MELCKDTMALVAERLEDLTDHTEQCRADGDDESADDWIATLVALTRVKEQGTVESLKANPDAAIELTYTLDRDCMRTHSGKPTASTRRVIGDLCRAGYGERHDPDAMHWSSSRGVYRPTTMVVDGIRYVVGR